MQVAAERAGQHTPVGVQAGHKPLRRLYQLDKVAAQGRLAAGKGQLRNARVAAFFNDCQPLVGVQLRHLGKGLAGGVAVQAFLVAVPRAILGHGADHQIHAVGRCHAGGVVAKAHWLHRHRRGLALRDGKQAVQQHLQVGFDLHGRRAAVNFARSGDSLRLHGVPVGGGNLLAGKRLQGVHQAGKQNRPADLQRQDVLPVQNGNKGGGAVGLAARHQMDAHRAGTVGVQRDMPHAVQVVVYISALSKAEKFHKNSSSPAGFIWKKYTIAGGKLQCSRGGKFGGI